MKVFQSGWSWVGKSAFLSLGVLVFVAAACSSGVPAEEVAAKDRQITELQAQVASLSGQVQSLQRDSTYWTQLTSLITPVQLKSMSDHRASMLPSGVLLALHFDNPDLNKAQNLNWVALGIPGKNCKEDQEQIEAKFGKGFTHFHDLVRDTHGSTVPGVEGVWFVHVAVRDFSSPMSGGDVKQGVDENFMPTPPPVCGS